MKRENLIPYSTIGKILNEKSNLRIGKDTKIIVSEILEDLGKKIVKKAEMLSKSSNKKTIKNKEIKLAYSQLKEF